MTAALRADPVARLATLAPTFGVGVLTADLSAPGAAERARHMPAAPEAR